MEIDARLLDPVKPQYGTASLSDVLPSVLSILDVPQGRDILGLAESFTGVRRVVVLLIDGLGYHLYPQAAAHSPLLAAAYNGQLGQMRQLTTNFPSTTPTSLVSLGAGVSPGEHGVLGFTVNVPGTDKVLTHIIWQDDPDPLTWQPVTTCFEHAANSGVNVSIVSRVYPSGGLSHAAFRGGRRVDVQTAQESATEVRKALADGDRSLVYGYFPTVDKMGHEYGVDSTQWQTAITEVEHLLQLIIADLPSDTGLLVTADHGMINVDGDETRIDVSQHPMLRDGVKLIAGEPRARYLHTYPGAVEKVAQTWRKVLGDRAYVWTRDEAVEAGWFGAMSPMHAARVGDVVVACRDRNVIIGVPESDGPTTGQLRGYHGSVSQAEMIVPLWSYQGSA